jgi:hypothetical protein
MALPNPHPQGHGIPLEEAAAMTRRYRESMHKGGLFLRADVDALLAQAECTGLRFYYGRGVNGEDTLILVGVDKEGNDMVNGVLLDGSFPCPPFCGGGNSLNS